MSTLGGDVAATFCATLVDEWVRCGIGFAVVSPGSRSSPMALALAGDDRIELLVRLDERSAAFIAVGIGLATRRPAVLLTTSGTAAAEVHAAVVEAHQARVPLLVCTADRPPQLRGVGAPQTIEQRGLYGSVLRYEAEAPLPRVEDRHWWRSLAARAAIEATANPGGPGPVHLNLPFEDPLVGVPGELPKGRSDGAAWHARPSAHGGPSAPVGPAAPSAPGDVTNDSVVEALVRTARRPLLVVGARPSLADDGSFLRAAAENGWPILADPRSGLRGFCYGPVVGCADALLRYDSFVASHEPDLVIRLGQPWASKVLNNWLDATAVAGVPHILVDPFGEWRDPGHSVAYISGAIGDLEVGAVEGSWTASWSRAEAAAQETIDRLLTGTPHNSALTEPLVARQLCAHPGIGCIVAASSMPVRDIEWFSAPRDGYPVVVSNRGANGIDGVVSTAIGVGHAWRGRGAVVGFVGDLAFLHDLTALVRPIGTLDPLSIVVLDNGGGGIFSYLPQARSVPPERFEQLFGTPQAVDPAALARAAGWRVTELDHPGDIDAALDDVASSPGVVVCHTDRHISVEVHEELAQAVAAAL